MTHEQALKTIQSILPEGSKFIKDALATALMKAREDK